MTRATNSVLEEVLQVVRSLEAKVLNLSCVVSSLETIIAKQNTTIEEQHNIVAKLSGKITELAVNKCIEQQKSTTNTPMIRNPLTESYASKSSKNTKKDTPPKPAVPSPAVKKITQACQSGRPDQVIRPIVKEKPSSQQTSGEAPWKTQRSKRRPAATTGQRADTNLQAVIKKKYIHAWRFSIDTTAEQLESYLDSVVGKKNIEVKALSNKGHYASFRVGVAEEDFIEFLDAEIWPKGISIGKYIFFSSKNYF